MSGLHDFIGIIVYAPALVRDDPRPMAVLHGMERALPGLHLDWTLSDEGRLVPLPRRDAWITQQLLTGDGVPLVCNDDDHQLVCVYGMESPARDGPGGLPLFDVHAHLPPDARGLAATADVLEAIAEASQAFWGKATSLVQAGADIAHQFMRSVDAPPPPRGLPALQLPGKLRSPEIPSHLGWMNYWSAATARTLGFPDPDQDAELLSRARRTSAGGWIISLTQETLNLDNPSHLQALLRAYERFPEIGGRGTP